MEEIYWITRLDSIFNIVLAITIISGLITTAMTITWLVCDSLYNSHVQERFNESWAKIGKSFVTWSFPLFLVFLIGGAFIPSTKEAYIIYGVGGTIDYIKSDQTAKQVPHKVIVAIDRYLDSLVDSKTRKKSGEEDEE